MASFFLGIPLVLAVFIFHAIEEEISQIKCIIERTKHAIKRSLMHDDEKLKYPIGKFQQLETISPADIRSWMLVIEHFPAKLKDALINVSNTALEKQYRPGGWTIRQIVHHCADSHMNSLIRFKLALTEETPTIKPYLEHLWAELPDTSTYPIEASLKILEGLHNRWTYLLQNLHETDLAKEFIHPETKEKISLKTNIGLYAWHCQHHLAHILLAKQN